MSLRNKYTIFNPKKPAEQGSFGSRSHDRLLKMFPGTLDWFGGKGKVEKGPGKDKDLYEHALEVFTPEYVKGDSEMWQYDNEDLYGTDAYNNQGSVPRNYKGAPDVYGDVLAGSRGLPGGPYVPNIASAQNADPNTLPTPPEMPDYNNVNKPENINSFNKSVGVFSPKVSSSKTRQTLGSTLKKGKSQNSE
jgi:hypothetical protein